MKADVVYQPKFKRWVHQETALQSLKGREAFALFMEMRTGKTKTILDEFGQDELLGALDSMLVIAPTGVYQTWKTDAYKHLSEDLKKRAWIHHWKSGPNLGERDRMQLFMEYGGPRIFLVNVEALSTVKAVRDLCTMFLQQSPATIVLDESTTIKNRKAARTKFCVKLAEGAAKRRILSGLPTPQAPDDIYSQFDFLQPGLLGCRTYEQFEQRYCITEKKPYGPGKRMVNIITGYQNLEELQDKVKQHSFRVRLSDCYDLPEKMYIRRDVELTDEQDRAYKEMQEFAVAELENAERVTATMVLTQMLRLHQILCGVTMSDDGVECDIAENRTTEMLDILANTDGKAIIWAAYGANVRRITAALQREYGPRSVAQFWGGNASTREDEEKQFKTNDACRFMVATAAAGGRGRTWDVADTVIYYSNTFSLEHRMQSEERTQAVGKKKSVGIFDLTTRDTVEDKILDSLRSKMDLSNAVTGDAWREWIA
jgi:hypothetical protein